jgi:hypothetical protein
MPIGVAALVIGGSATGQSRFASTNSSNDVHHEVVWRSTKAVPMAAEMLSEDSPPRRVAK